MDIMTKEECQALIDSGHIWEDVDLTKKRGSVLKFMTADINMWKDKYPNVLHECVIKYEVGDFCSEHTDVPWRKIHPDYHAVSGCIIPLNDDYEGGKLYFNGEFTEQVVGVPIKYIRTIPHEITKVTKGTRYSQVSWVFVKNEPGSWWDKNTLSGDN